MAGLGCHLRQSGSRRRTRKEPLSTQTISKLCILSLVFGWDGKLLGALTASVLQPALRRAPPWSPAVRKAVAWRDGGDLLSLLSEALPLFGRSSR